MPSSSRSFCSNASRPSRNDAARFGRKLLVQVLNVAADRLGRFRRRVREIAEQVHVVERGKRARQIFVDELQRAPERLEADLHEDARRILDVVARGLHQPRRSAAASRARGAPAPAAARE